MSLPNQMVVRHLRIAFTPVEYQAVTQQTHYQRAGSFSKIKAGSDYWGRIPSYLIARCPLCGVPYAEELDTHSLLGWGIYPGFWDFVYTNKRERLGEDEIDRRLEEIESGTTQPGEYWESTFEATPQRVKCKHFVAVQFFINLHSVVPKEVTYFSNQSEVPFVMPVFLPDDIESYVVMHSLPICRIEKNKFVPRYSLYLLTYYSMNPQALWKRRQAEFKGGDALHFSKLYTWRTIELNNLSEAWDLSLWVKRGKLFWLELEQDDLPLKSGSVKEFPYANIEGIRKSHTYRKGKLKVDAY